MTDSRPIGTGVASEFRLAPPVPRLASISQGKLDAHVGRDRDRDGRIRSRVPLGDQPVRGDARVERIECSRSPYMLSI